MTGARRNGANGAASGDRLKRTGPVALAGAV